MRRRVSALRRSCRPGAMVAVGSGAAVITHPGNRSCAMKARLILNRLIGLFQAMPNAPRGK
jgi:hypothetical protein